MAKRGPLDAFFAASSSKKQKTDDELPRPLPRSGKDCDQPASSEHAAYPHAIAALPISLAVALLELPAAPASNALPSRPNLDTLYFAPFVARDHARALFLHLRSALPFYRVQYSILRGTTRTSINTPRFTTVFGVDDSARFDPQGRLANVASGLAMAPGTYRRQPRPLPASLDALRQAVERATGARYNFCLVNYYADGNDSISYHSDDERFLGPNPCIASLSLGGVRDFLLRPKADPKCAEATASPDTIKLPLESGDMVVMRGPTQANWLHSIPKRKGDQAKRGRINITFRRALTRQGTDNYYCYNVGDGGVWRWNDARAAMVLVGSEASDAPTPTQETTVNWR